MNARKLLGLLAAGAFAAAAFAPAGATAKAAKPVVIGTDAVGDFGTNVDANLGPLGDALGMDLVEASISGDAKTINFAIKLNSLPPVGGTPEVARYVWDLNVNGEYVELDGKFTNYSRGACDPTAGTCPPPRDPGLQPFLVRGNCTTSTTGTNVTTCEEIGLVQATFDTATATITIPVPSAMIGAKPGSKITPATTIFGGTVSAAPAAFVSNTAGPVDTLTATKTFVVPR